MLGLATVSVNAQLTNGDFSYSTNNSNWITLTGYTGSGGSVVIPETISGMPVRSIGASAFANKVSVTSISLPTNLTTISDSAFFNTRIYSVVVPTNVTSIGASAFSNCAYLSYSAVHVNLVSYTHSFGLLILFCCTCEPCFIHPFAWHPHSIPLYM